MNTMDNSRNKDKPFAETEREKLRELLKQRGREPPWEALPWSSEWAEYVEEMREIERQLREAGEDL